MYWRYALMRRMHATLESSEHGDGNDRDSRLSRYQSVDYRAASSQTSGEHSSTIAVGPLSSCLNALAQRLTSNLRATRDLLLPRLISGEIDVTDLDIAVPDLAA